MRLDASGRLGIGTSTPSQALDVLGMVNIGRNQNSNVTNLNINSGSTPVSAFQISTDQPNLLAYINSRNSYDLGLFTNDVERLRISSTGNVGIGTATPSYKLEIYNAGGASAVIGGATGKIYVYGDDSGGTVGTLSSIPLRFATNGTERMRITSSGSVGIGTTSPNIDGGTATALTINSAASGGRLELASGGTRYAQYFAGSSAAYLTTYTSIPLVFETNASERMRITSGGNVGIGSSNPQEKFVVSNGSSLNIEINPSYIQSFNRTSATYNDLSFFSSTFIVNTGTSPTERMRITSGGELLINTTSDAGDYKLQVNGNVYAGGQLRIETSSSPAINIVKNATVDNRYIRFTNSEASSKDWDIINRPNANSNELAFYNNTDGVFALKLGTTGNGEFAGSIKTAAPSGGTAKPWKLGEAGVTLGGSNTSGVRVEIDGTVYYLVTGYLP
jgi:hypothetical protein